MKFSGRLYANRTHLLSPTGKAIVRTTWRTITYAMNRPTTQCCVNVSLLFTWRFSLNLGDGTGSVQSYAPCANGWTGGECERSGAVTGPPASRHARPRVAPSPLRRPAGGAGSASSSRLSLRPTAAPPPLVGPACARFALLGPLLCREWRAPLPPMGKKSRAAPVGRRPILQLSPPGPRGGREEAAPGDGDSASEAGEGVGGVLGCHRPVRPTGLGWGWGEALPWPPGRP